MKTYMANPQTVERKWYIVDATGLTLGRLASKVASVLVGKHKPSYTPHVDTGDFVIVINCKDLVLTGKKLTDKYYRHHSGFPGGLKEVQYKHLMEKKPEFAFYQAVKGMMPKNALGRNMIKKLKVYADANHGHEAQKPEVLDLKEGDNK
ncbi:MAG: 50S ribosomal protein L13 [Clostridia bacterium]|nr:50S ribosomal protein L13 [Clostridia bacterium]